jgi:hypothetical protein
MRRDVMAGTGRKVITQARARQLAALTYDTAADWYHRGWMSEAEWQGYQAAYSRGVDGGPSEPGAWAPMRPDVEAIAGAITCSIGVRNGRLFDERGMDDPAPWADYGAGSLTKQELLALRKQLQVGHKFRLAAVGRDPSDATAGELDELFDDLLYERAAWLEPHAAAVTEAAGAACPPLRASAQRGKVAAAAAGGPGGELTGDSPYRAAVAAIESFGRTAARHEQAVATLEAELTLHGLDRDPALMTHVRALQDATAATTNGAVAALKTLQSRHSAGDEYHTSARDAAASAVRPAG